MVQKQFACPWCFGKCYDDEVIFRSTFGVDRKNVRVLSQLSESDQASFLKYDKENPDTVLDAFWKRAGGESGYKNNDPEWDMPHIWYRKPHEKRDNQELNPDFARLIRTQNTGSLKIDEYGFVRDEDGFILRVVDKYGDANSDMKRLCPHCHNPLPLNNYGKYPITFIAIVGMTNAGKTVYLIQLLKNLLSSLGRCGYTVEGSNLHELKETVSKGVPLPANTDLGMRRPLAVNIKKIGDERLKRTLVFYDIAGENCVYAIREDGKVRDDIAITKFIANCDGLLFLIDPEQTNTFSENVMFNSEGKNGLEQAIEVCEKVHNIRPSWSNIPVAAVITKSDKIQACKEHLGLTDDVIFTNIDYTAESYGFARKQFVSVNNKIESLLCMQDTNLFTALRAFAPLGYFMVSAITCGVEGHFNKYKNNYKLSIDSTEKFAELRKWCMEWNSRTPEERMYYRPCPVKWIDGSSIQLPNNLSTTEVGRSKVTELTAADVEAWQNEIHLSLDDALSLTVVGYPAGFPDPRRVEEPVLWILWQLGIVGPLPNMAEVHKDSAYKPIPQEILPSKPFSPFPWKKKEWEQQCDAMQNEWDQEQAQKIWYYR